MKLLIYALLFGVLVLYVTGFEISFKPFSIKFTNLYIGLAWVGVWVSVTAVIFLEKQKSYLEGMEKGNKITEQVFVEIVNKEIAKLEAEEKAADRAQWPGNN
jgi:hypothetical protein